MPNIGTLLKEEISRISRREIRKQVEPLRKASAAYRKDIAALKRELQQLQRQTKVLAKRPRSSAAETSGGQDKPLRFVAKGLVSLRARLGLSATDLARLLGVSGQSVYNWEHRKSVPRKEQVASLATLRSVGKREVRARLDAMAEPKARKTAR